MENFEELDPFPGQRQGREDLKEVSGRIRNAFPDVHWVLDEMVAEGDKVVSRFTWSGTHRNSFLGIPAIGKRVKMKGGVIDRLREGRLADSRILLDRLTMLEQLGALPTPQTGD